MGLSGIDWTVVVLRLSSGKDVVPDNNAHSPIIAKEAKVVNMFAQGVNMPVAMKVAA